MLFSQQVTQVRHLQDKPGFLRAVSCGSGLPSHNYHVTP